MTQKEKDFLNGLFKVTFGWDETKVAALFNADGSDVTDEALNTALDADKSRIKAINDRNASEVKNSDDLGYKRATKEILTKFEDELKEHFSIKSDKKGLELLKHVVTEKSKGTPGQITEDEIRKSKVYLDLETQLKKAENDSAKAIADAVSKKEMEYKAKDTQSFVRKAALEYIRNELKPVLPLNDDGSVNEKLADKQLGYLLGDIMNGNGWDVVGDGDEKQIVPLDKDGKPLVDTHGRTREFFEIVKNKTVESFPLQKSEPKGSPKNPKGSGGGSGGGADEKQYAKLNLKPAKSKEDWSKGLIEINGSKLSEDEKAKARIQFDDDSKIEMAKAG